MKSQLSLIILAIVFAATNGLQCFSCGNATNCDVYSASIVSCPNDTLPALNFCVVIQSSNSLQRGCANADYCQVYSSNSSVTCNLCGNNKCNGVAKNGFSWGLFVLAFSVKYIIS
ncbi:hypothetical protein ACFFRR_000263 [Megaselia abdita]